MSAATRYASSAPKTACWDGVRVPTAAGETPVAIETTARAGASPARAAVSDRADGRDRDEQECDQQNRRASPRLAARLHRETLPAGVGAPNSGYPVTDTCIGASARLESAAAAVVERFGGW